MCLGLKTKKKCIVYRQEGKSLCHLYAREPPCYFRKIRPILKVNPYRFFVHFPTAYLQLADINHLIISAACST